MPKRTRHYQAAIQPLPGARELLRQLSRAKRFPYRESRPSGRPEGARSALEKLGIGPEIRFNHTAGSPSAAKNTRPRFVFFLLRRKRLNVPIARGDGCRR